MLATFLQDDGHNIVFNGHYLDVCIPESYFAVKLAVIEGSILKTFGLLNCIVYDKNDKVISNDILNIPSTIALNVTNINHRTINLSELKDSEPQPYRVIRYYKNDAIMSNEIQADVGNVETFVNMLITGKIDNIPYNSVIDVWHKCLSMNGVHMGLPSVTLELMVSGIYRNKNNPDEKMSRAFQHDPKTSQFAYRAINMRELCARNSTFTALTFEDMDSMITASLNMTNYNKKQTSSPIEDMIKY